MDCAGYRFEEGLVQGSSWTDDCLRPEQERIRRDVTDAESDPSVGVHLKSWDWSSDRPYALLSVAGPEETPFEGGHFEVEIRCSPTWPSLWFKTKVWHPKVCSTTGEVSSMSEEDLVTNEMSTLIRLGLQMRNFLAHPKMVDSKNPEAARQYRDNIDEFNRTARDWTARHAKLNLCQDPGHSISLGDGAEEGRGGCGLSINLDDHQALSDLFRGRRQGLGAGITSLSGWYYALCLHDDGRLACLNLTRHALEGELTSSVGKFVALTHLYLADNLLTGTIPRELCNARSLQVLILSGNQLEGRIPEYIGCWRALRILHLSKNRLTGAIPDELCNIKGLQDLRLEKNQLEGHIPEYFGNFPALRYLELDGNRLTGTIPKELCNARRLEVIGLSGNQLEGCIPETLSDLDRLEILDLRQNRLTGLWDHTEDGDYEQSAAPVGERARFLPDALTQLLDYLEDLREKNDVLLDNNPWKEPPEAIVEKGMKASREYFEALYADHFSVRRTNLKVVLVGHGGAGKTSLRQSIREQRPTPTEGAMESTVHIDVENIKLDDTTVRFYDCAGQVAYTGLLQTFLTRKSLILLVCDAAAFGQRDESLDDNSRLDLDIRSLDNLRVCDWLRSLSFRIPYSAVILVATKCDLVRRDDTATIAGRFEDACSKWLDTWVKGSIKRVQIEPGVSLTSCARNEGQEEAESWSCDWEGGETVCRAKSPLRLQHRIVRKSNGELRGVNQVVPRSLDIALTVLDALGEGREPFMAGRKRYFQEVDEQGGTHEGKAYSGITVQELKRKWFEVVQGLREKGASIYKPEKALDWAMTIREFEGSLVRHETYVFLDVVWLAKILKPLINHKVRKNANLSITLGDIGDSLSSVTLTDREDIRSWEKLEKDGILEPRLAKAMWDNLSRYVLPTLDHLGLTFPLNDDSTDGVVVMLRLPTERPQEVGEEIDYFREDHDEVFRVRWEMGLGVPPGAVERVLTRCCRIGNIQTFWRFGVLVRGGVEYGEFVKRFALVMEYFPDSCDKVLDIRIYGNVYSSASWAVLSYALSAVRYMTLDFPGLQWRAWLDCPQPRHVGKKHEIRDLAIRPGKKLLRVSGCNLCHPMTGGLGAAAVELLQMVDINEDKDKIFQGMEERFGEVRHQFKELLPEGVPEHRRTNVEHRMVNALNGVDPENLQELPQFKNILETLLLQKASNSSEWSQTLNSVMENDDGVMGRLDFIVEMVMAERANKISAPRMACVLPPWGFTKSQGLTETEMAAEMWMERYAKWRDGDFKEGKGFLKTEMRLFLLCAHSKELVPCGHEGQGYRVVRSRKWVRQTARLAKILYPLASTPLQMGPVVGAAANTVGTAAVDYAEEKASVGYEANLARQLRNVHIADGDLQHELKGKTYEYLQKFVHEMEFRTLQDASKERQSFQCFEKVMVQVQARSGDAKAQWVLKKNKQAWLDGH